MNTNKIIDWLFNSIIDNVFINTFNHGVYMCEIYGFCGNRKLNLNKYTDVFWSHSKVHKDGFGYYLADKNEDSLLFAVPTRYMQEKV